MPELPEVEFCRRSLARWTAGRRVVHVTVADPRSIRVSRTAAPSAADPEGERRLREVVTEAEPGVPLRHGKRVLWLFGDRALLLHLGMTGKWSRSDGPHHKVALHLDDGGVLWFHDPRLLGGIVPTTRADGPALLREGLGPDALGNPLPPLRGKRAVKVALLDQALLAGLGNLHAAEALWRAGIHPATPCDAVTTAQHAALERGIAEQLRFALALDDGHDEIQYVEDRGAPNPFPLYGRRGAPCPRCGTPIATFPQAGRTTWWCPTCQPAVAA